MSRDGQHLSTLLPSLSPSTYQLSFRHDSHDVPQLGMRRKGGSISDHPFALNLGPQNAPLVNHARLSLPTGWLACWLAHRRHRTRTRSASSSSPPPPTTQSNHKPSKAASHLHQSQSRVDYLQSQTPCLNTLSTAQSDSTACIPCLVPPPRRAGAETQHTNPTARLFDASPLGPGAGVYPLINTVASVSAAVVDKLGCATGC